MSLEFTASTFSEDVHSLVDFVLNLLNTKSKTFSVHGNDDLVFEFVSSDVDENATLEFGRKIQDWHNECIRELAKRYNRPVISDMLLTPEGFRLSYSLN
jgi:hypothetical protein